MKLFKVLSLVFVFQSFSAFASNKYFNGAVATDYQFKIDGENLGGYLNNSHRDIKKAVIIGAGPAGLMGALMLRYTGYEVLVFEKRDNGQFNRFNMINLKNESESALNFLGLLEQFQKEVGSHLDHHRIVSKNGDTIVELEREEVAKLRDKGKNHSFTEESLANQFKSSGTYTVMVGDYQRFLAKAARDRGVHLFLNTQTELSGTVHQQKSIKAVQNGAESTIEADLIVLADGASGSTEKTAIQLVEDHPCQGEKWVFGNVDYDGDQAVVVAILDYSTAAQNGYVTIANVIFNPKFHQANLAVSLNQDEIDDKELQSKIEDIARIAFAQLGSMEVPHLKVASGGIIKIKNQHVNNAVLGKNVIVTGDRVGSSSPLAGLGATLASTSYPYAIRDLGRAIQAANGKEEEIEEAMEAYNRIAQASVKKWLATSADVKNHITEKGR